MRFFILLLAFVASLCPLAAQGIRDADCNFTGDKSFDRNGRLRITIRIRLKIPQPINKNSQFDFIEARKHPDGKWDIILADTSSDGDGIQKYLGGLSDSQTVDALDSICTGAADRALQMNSGTISTPAARMAIVPPASGQTSNIFDMADLNGDGFTDSVAIQGSSVRVRLLRADGSVISSQSYSAPPDPEYVATGDFNGDNRPELVVASKVTNPPSGETWFYLNNGSGTFQTGQPVNPTVNVVKAGPVAIGDFSGDGKVDLIYSSPTGFRRHEGNGTGGFTGSDGFSLGIQPYSLVTADFNGDGRLDVVAHDRFNNTVALRFGTGAGFATAVTSTAGPAQGDKRGYLAYSDFNHDGRLDLLIRYATSHTLSLLLGNSDGTFQAAKNYAAPGENPSVSVMPLADGAFLIFLPDHVAGEVVVYQAPGDGTILAPTMETSPATITAVTAGDYNGDGFKDLVLGTANNQALLRRGSASGAFQTLGYSLNARPTGALSADLNGDGRTDAVISLRNGNIASLLGNADGTLSNATFYPAGTSPFRPQLADFNKDGKLDLAAIPELFSGGQGRVAVLRGNGDGSFQAATLLATNAGDVTGIAAGDFTGDQNPDIVVTTVTGGGFGAGHIALFRGRGDGTFMDPSTTPISSSYGLASGDFDGDSKLDLAIIQSGISIVMGNGNGTWRAGASVPVLTGGTEILSADLNRDGILDLVNNACCGQTRTTYLLGYGNGTFAPEEVLAAPLDPAPAAIADINGDTWPEIALGGTDGFFTINYPSLTNLYIVNSASGKLRVTPDSIASAYGIRLATQANPAGTTVTVKDSAGTTRNSFVYYSSPGFLNFTIPAGTALGESTVTVTSADGTRSSTKVNTTTVIPGLYVLNLNGLVAANVLRVNASGSTYEDLFQLSNGAIVPKAINLGPPTDEIFLLLYGTGIRAAGKAGTSVTIGGIPVTVDYSGPQGAPGFDQVNIKLPRTLIGKGATELVLTANGEVANTVTLTIQ